VCVEALILGRPVISVNVNERRDLTGLVQDGLAIGAYDEDGIKRSVASCLEKAEKTEIQIDKTRALLVPFVYYTDGHASQRVAELVKIKSTRANAPP
jgi:UDP-N-acetylglucosamine 2-epimerase